MVESNSDSFACCAPLNLKRNADSSQQGDFSSPSVARGGQQTNTIASPAHDKYPDLPKTEWSLGGQFAHFNVESKGYNATVDGEVTYARGWIQQIIQLGDTVPASTGGVIDKDFGAAKGSGPSFSGGGWRYAKQDTNSPTKFTFWDGATWQNVPAAWADPTATKMCGCALWIEDGQTKSQYGNSWPEKLPEWGDADRDLLSSKVPKWQRAIESTWNGLFDIRRKECPSSDDQCCRYHVKMTANFVELPAKDAIIVLAPNYARSNSVVWSLADTRDQMAAHEYGHHIGNPDEYVGGIGVDESMNEDGAAQGVDENSVMGQNNTPAKKRHFRFIGMQLSAMVDTASKKQNGFTHEPVPAK